MFKDVPKSESGGEGDNSERWHISEVVKALNERDIGRVLTELKRAWMSGYKITFNPISIKEEGIKNDDPEEENIYNRLRDFIISEIEDGKLTIEQRIKFFRFVYPYDYPLSQTFIEPIGEDEENPYDVGLLDTPDLNEMRDEYYEWLTENQKDINVLYEALQYDGYLDENSEQKINKELKKKIRDYVKNRIENADRKTKDKELEIATDILLSFEEEEN